MPLQLLLADLMGTRMKVDLGSGCTSRLSRRRRKSMQKVARPQVFNLLKTRSNCSQFSCETVWIRPERKPSPTNSLLNPPRLRSFHKPQRELQMRSSARSIDAFAWLWLAPASLACHNCLAKLESQTFRRQSRLDRESFSLASQSNHLSRHRN